MLNQHYFKLNLAASAIRHTTVDGRPYMILPATILVEGVHNGSSGSLLYTTEELRASAPKWNQKPIVLGHPMSNGTPISVNNVPDKVFGHVSNVNMIGNKLKADLYLDKINTVLKAPQVLQALDAGKDVEVSTGLLSNDQPPPGTWNGEAYQAIVRNIRPDHLAILLDQRGACSWQDGCGIRANVERNTFGNVSTADILYFCGYRKGANFMTVNETPLHLPQPCYRASSSAIEMVRAHLIANFGPEIGIQRLQELSALEVEREAERLITCGGRQCDAHRIDNATTEQPLELPAWR